MPREKKTIQEDQPPGAPIWMLTYSDCVTLLLTFFVLLMSFSTFDDRIFYKLKVIYSDAFYSIQTREAERRDSRINIELQNQIDRIDDGSNSPTLDSLHSGALNETLTPFENQKVFLIHSDKVFWGNAIALSSEGQEALKALAAFLHTVKGNIVISEISRQTSQDKQSRDISLKRAWHIAQFFIKNHNLPMERFNISSGTTVGDFAFDVLRLESPEDTHKKVIEIVLVDKNIYP
jgi:chemotaxis protein MotB